MDQNEGTLKQIDEMAKNVVDILAQKKTLKEALAMHDGLPSADAMKQLGDATLSMIELLENQALRHLDVSYKQLVNATSQVVDLREQIQKSRSM